MGCGRICAVHGLWVCSWKKRRSGHMYRCADGVGYLVPEEKSHAEARSGERPYSFELLFEPLIDALTNVVGKVVGGVGVFDDELVLGFEELDHGPGGGDAFCAPLHAEVGMVQ